MVCGSKVMIILLNDSNLRDCENLDYSFKNQDSESVEEGEGSKDFYKRLRFDSREAEDQFAKWWLKI